MHCSGVDIDVRISISIVHLVIRLTALTNMGSTPRKSKVVTIPGRGRQTADENLTGSHDQFGVGLPRDRHFGLHQLTVQL